jgi:hypothetical protein
MKRGAVSSLLVLAMLAGCGGGGGGSTILSGGGGPAPTLAPAGSAKFTVDARTGEVKVEPLSDSRAVFAGSALSFTSTQLLSEGSPERRLIRVSAKNNTQEEIGASGRIRLVFSDFRNENTAATDLRSLTRTETVLGNGTAGTTFGAASTATINAPAGLVATTSPKAVYISSQGTVRLEADTASRYSGHVFDGTAIARLGSFMLTTTATSIQVPNEGSTSTIITGSITASTHLDGDFATARFTQINDLHIISGTDENNFSAVVADGTRLRSVVRNSSVPNGSVTTYYDGSDPIHGYTQKDGYEYLSLGNRVFVVKGNAVTPISSSAVGFQDGLGTTSRFNGPRHLRWVGDSLFVADSGNNRVRKLNLRPGGLPGDSGSWWVSTISGNGTASAVNGVGIMTHNGPHGLTQGAGDELYVSDRAGNRVRRVTPTSGRFAGYTGDSSPNPTILASMANADGFLPSNPIRLPYMDKEISIAPGATGQLGDWQFILPEGLSSFSFIVKVEADTVVPSVLPAVMNTGTGTKGSPLVDVQTFAGNVFAGFADGPLSIAAFQTVRDICFADDGTMFTSDAFGIRRIDTSGEVTTLAGGPGNTGSTLDGYGDIAKVQGTVGISCNPEGTLILFTQFNSVVRALVLEPGTDPKNRSYWSVVTLVGAADTPGTISFGTGDQVRLNYPTDVVYVTPNLFYIVDSVNHTILRATKTGASFIAQSIQVSLLAGGTVGYVDSSSSFARFDTPKDAAITPSGELLVTDVGNNRIRVINTSGVTTTLSGGPVGFKDNSSPNLVEFNGLSGISVDRSGYIYVGSRLSRLVKRIAPNGASATVAGTANTSGRADGTGNTALLQDIYGLAVTPSGDLFVADENRIRKIQRIISN